MATQKWIDTIIEEYDKACAKHPLLCDVYTTKELRVVRNGLKDLRERNSEGPYKADSILYEEVAEATEAYLQGDIEHCLQKLAQCGAVIMRMMDFVQKEMETEEPKPRRATNRELAKWIARGNGEVKDIIDVVLSFCSYPTGLENTEVRNGIKTRKWDDTEWHEPTVDYIGLEA